MDKFAKYAGGLAGRTPGISRRGFLIGAAGAGFTLAFLKPDLLIGDAEAAEAVAAHSFEPALWYDIDRDGIVTVNITRAEMGQHVGTALARIVADELEADWNAVRLRYVDSDPKWGYMVTGGSWSVWQSFPYLSQAGAAGRTALIEEGAKLLGVAKESCMARNSVVSGGGKSITYAEIIRHGGLTRVFTPEQLKTMPIKTAAERRLIGLPTKALDIPDKTRGTAVYGIDAEVPGMVYARPKLPPSRYGCTVRHVDDSYARKVPGYLKYAVLDDPSGTVPGWVIVYAENYPAAIQATDALVVDWSVGEAVKASEGDMLAHGFELLKKKDGGAILYNDHGVDAAFKKAKTVLEADYSTNTVLHFQLEPVNGIAFEKDGVWEIHSGTQWQSLILPTLAKALEVPESKIVLRTYLLGGGFGRRLNGDYTVPVALAAKAYGGPVKLVLTRPDDARFDCPRSFSAQHLRMAFDAKRNVLGMEHHATAGWPTQVLAPEFLQMGTNQVPFDPFSIAGADHWYNVGPHRVRAISHEWANRTFRPGWLRAVGPGWTNWALESFVDEAAHFKGIDPLAFRLAMLDGSGHNAGAAPNATGGAKRQAAVLKRVAEKAGWGQPLPPATALGIATSFGQEREMPTWTACVARVRVDRSNGRIIVEKLTMVIDAGTIVHPDGALAQAEGATLWGLSMALYEGTEFKNGQVRDTNLSSYTPLRLGDVPELDIEFVPSTETPVGLGEPGTTVVAPAIANAIFTAVGIRLRHLPMRQKTLLAALKPTST